MATRRRRGEILYRKQEVTVQWGRHVSSKIIQELKVCLAERSGWLSKGKRGLVKGHMTRDDDPIRGAIKAAVSLVMSRVAEKDRVWSAVQAYARLWQ